MIRNYEKQRRQNALAAIFAVASLVVLLGLAVASLHAEEVEVEIVNEVGSTPYAVVDGDGKVISRHQREDKAVEKAVNLGGEHYVVRDGRLRVTVQAPEPASQAVPFRFYEAVFNSSSPPDGWPEKVHSIGILYGSDLWPPDHDRTEPHLETVRAAVVQEAAEHDIIVLNVEHWELHGNSDDEALASAEKYISLLGAARVALDDAGHDDVRIGLYSMIPVRHYWAPVSGDPQQLEWWYERNDLIARIAEHVDIVFPSLYTFYYDERGWRIYARANVAEAKAYGKPVMPFVWPTYHDSTELRDQPIPAEFWRMQLETIRGLGCEGVVLWRAPGHGWDDGAEWWQATRAFLEGVK